MDKKTENKPQGVKKFIYLVVLSFLAGCINGFVGTGGGILMVLLLFMLDGGGEKSTRDVFARTLVTVIPMTLTAFTVYQKSSNVDMAMISRLFVPISLGGALGAAFMDRIDTKWLNLIFSILVIYSGISMGVRVL